MELPGHSGLERYSVIRTRLNCLWIFPLFYGTDGGSYFVVASSKNAMRAGGKLSPFGQL